MFSKKISYQSNIFYLVIFFDLTNVRETMQYFQQSFDQFMDTTIKLEKALATIEKQKSEIEVINQELREKGEIMKKDMEIAIILQNELLPSLPNSPDWDMSLCYKPMLGVSGDTYDFHLFPDMDFMGVVLLDASGHGIASSLITNIARPAFLRSHMRYRKDRLEKAMEASNRELIRQIGEAPNYLTGLSIRLYPNSFTYVNSGHPYILFYQAKNGKVSELENDGILLGVKGFPQNYNSFTKKTNTGDIILIYTDGLTEAANRQNKEFGVRKIKEILKGNVKDAAGIKEDILKKLLAYGINIEKLHDDMTFIIMKKK
jgi:sigma-B regulation protein RsbU (phosphoserine phosphatase)